MRFVTLFNCWIIAGSGWLGRVIMGWGLIWMAGSIVIVIMGSVVVVMGSVVVVHSVLSVVVVANSTE